MSLTPSPEDEERLAAIQAFALHATGRLLPSAAILTVALVYLLNRSEREPSLVAWVLKTFSLEDNES